MPRSLCHCHAAAVALLTLSVACAGKATAPEQAGVLTVGISTTGPSASTLAFPIEISSTRADAEPPKSERIKADGGIATFRDLAGGPYLARLSLPKECEAAGGPSRQLTIAPRRTTAVHFVVTCR
jgi:hypothetical protein